MFINIVSLIHFKCIWLFQYVSYLRQNRLAVANVSKLFWRLAKHERCKIGVANVSIL